MARFRRAIRGRGKPVHPTTWCGHAWLNFNATNGSGSNIVCGESEFELYTSPTIVRVRGYLSIAQEVGADLGTSIGHTQQIWNALMIAPTGAAAPDLSTKDGIEEPLLWFHFASLGTRLTENSVWNGSAVQQVAQEYAGEASSIGSIPIDVKAMRRVPKGYELRLVTTVVDTAGSWDVRVRGSLRTLIKE